MSVQASAWVIENSQHKGSELLCLLMISNHAHADGTNAFPSVTTLAKECRMSTRQVNRIISRLEASGELAIDRSTGRYANRYSLPLMNPDKMAGLKDNSGRVNRTSNPDIVATGFDITPTLTNPTPNPDIAVSANPDIAVSDEPSLTVRRKETTPSGVATRTGKPETPASVCRRITGRTPTEVQRQEINTQVTDLAHWRETLEQFMLEGRPPNRVDWMLDRYHGKSPPTRAAQAHSPPADTGWVVTMPTLDMVACEAGISIEEARIRYAGQGFADTAGR